MQIGFAVREMDGLVFVDLVEQVLSVPRDQVLSIGRWFAVAEVASSWGLVEQLGRW